MLRIFMPIKIQRLRPGLNPQTWVPEASMLTTRPPKPSWEDRGFWPQCQQTFIKFNLSIYLFIQFNITWFPWTFLAAVSKARSKCSGNTSTLCFRPLWNGNASHKCLHKWTQPTSFYLEFEVQLLSFSYIPQFTKTCCNRTKAFDLKYTLNVIMTEILPV